MEFEFDEVSTFPTMGILTRLSVDSDEPVQSPFKLRKNSKRFSVSNLTVIEYSSN